MDLYILFSHMMESSLVISGNIAIWQWSLMKFWQYKIINFPLFSGRLVFWKFLTVIWIYFAQKKVELHLKTIIPQVCDSFTLSSRCQPQGKNFKEFLHTHSHTTRMGHCTLTCVFYKMIHPFIDEMFVYLFESSSSF